MIKFTYDDSENRVLVSSLKIGETFMYGGRYYILIQYVTSTQFSSKWNCVNLADGCLSFIHDYVTAVDIEATVKEAKRA